MTTNEHHESKHKRDDLTGTNGPVITPGLESAGGYGRARLPAGAPTRATQQAPRSDSATQRTAQPTANGRARATGAQPGPGVAESWKLTRKITLANRPEAEYGYSASRSHAMTCAHCGTEYTRGRRGPAGKYCSNGCRVRAWEARSPAMFQAYRTRQADRNLRRRRERVFTCSTCQAEFCVITARGRFPVYCSRACLQQEREKRFRAEHGISRQTAWLRKLDVDVAEQARAARAEHERGDAWPGGTA